MGECANGDKRRKRGRRERLAPLCRDSRGATAIEYGLILALVVVVILISVQGLANVTIAMWNDISTKTVSAMK